MPCNVRYGIVRDENDVNSRSKHDIDLLLFFALASIFVIKVYFPPNADIIHFVLGFRKVKFILQGI